MKDAYSFDDDAAANESYEVCLKLSHLTRCGWTRPVEADTGAIEVLVRPPRRWQ